ncbi:MAG TPA: UDP-N-acetylmuramoyl-tripeptide--D-alanyl-D-alanine ligase, partial [Bacteroidia bacterium]|nr:UDP-N-acetylmuramoyl-tripeptide--D-alanyl-D-alanine ligase [Bacteroidia bacterium]
FFALKGDSFDGNQFAETALNLGASYAVIDDEKKYHGDKYILVEDVLTCLQQLATYHRKQLKSIIIAITGSNGKTTTKELIKKVLEKKYRTLATQGNLNNHIGVPLTLLSITPEIELAIVEMGANHVGEIAMLCNIAQPDYGMITNIGKAHIGEFGSFENIIQAKTELYAYIKSNGKKIFVNAEDALLMKHARGIDQITYGTRSNAYCRSELVEVNPFLKIVYENQPIQSKLIGTYNFDNITLAICIGKYFGIGIADIKNAIEEYVPSNNRSQIVKTKSNEIVLDAYNANPSSMMVAIQNFYQMKGDDKWLILGDMLELGQYEVEEHKSIIKLIESKKFKHVILVGNRFDKAVLELGSNFPVFKTSDELLNVISHQYRIKDALILIKGSRGMKLERVVDSL